MHQSLVLSLIAFILLGATASAQHEARMATTGFPLQTRGALQAVLMTPKLSVGQNRVAFELLINETTFVADAAVVVRVYALHDQQPQLHTELRAFYEPLEPSVQGHRVSLPAERRPQGANMLTEAEGIYVAQVLFDRSGPWGLEMLIAQDDGPVEVARLIVHVLAPPSTTAYGVSRP